MARTASQLIWDGDDLDQMSHLRRAVDVAENTRDALREQRDSLREQLGALREKATAEEADDSIRLDDDSATERAILAGEAALVGVEEALEAAEAQVLQRQQAYNDFTIEAEARATVIKIRSIGSGRFRRLMQDHPPRTVTKPGPPNEDGTPGPTVEDTHPDDLPFGVNAETFPMALLTYIDPEKHDVRTILEPRRDGPARVQEFVEDDVDEGDFDPLWQAAFFINRMPSADPKASLYSVPARSSTET